MPANTPPQQPTATPDFPGMAIALDTPPYSLSTAQKQPLLLDALNALTAWHAQHCTPYANMRQRMFGTAPAACREDVPWLPVRLFKTQDLMSSERSSIIKTLTSSGTTGQAVSRIYLDRETSLRQTRVLTAIMASFLGKQRLPMVIVDSADLLKDRSRFNARAAGILGFSVFGRQHHYCLDAGLDLQIDALQDFLAQHRGAPILAFGFTFVVWQRLLQAVIAQGRKLDFGPGSTLIHGGGWKRLQDQQVNNATFKALLREHLGLERIFNYYGMVEQVGSIFMECEHGHLHAPAFADVIVRDPLTLEPLPPGREGAVQVLSALPVSYPGHSLLTEDLGVLHGEDDCPCGRHGRYFSVLGRLPQAELRGCSDTRAIPA
ncbi:LuxE/PaaK family acyltransferase [Comamonas aquatica]|uniref:LuxE/PaaK family acyltransferase n=1 Tax=Comamonas aquatica TaxID=225991 RepID=UPI000A9EAEAA|nr:acyl-protein synthetase [Comamonas aquatica]